jgi:hypothetical protein
MHVAIAIVYIGVVVRAATIGDTTAQLDNFDVEVSCAELICDDEHAVCGLAKPSVVNWRKTIAEHLGWPELDCSPHNLSPPAEGCPDHDCSAHNCLSPSEQWHTACSGASILRSLVSMGIGPQKGFIVGINYSIRTFPLRWLRRLAAILRICRHRLA